MIYISITNFARINHLEKDHSMIEMRRLKNVAIFFQNNFKLTVIPYFINNILVKFQ